MKIVQKQVSLEPMTSRLPGLYPAYKDGELYFFDNDHLKARGYEFPTNYGMIPVMLRLTKQPTEINCDSGPSIVSCTGDFTISWERLSQWYSFFKEYYHLLNDYGHCGVRYDSAVDYYINESREKYANQMIYGTEESIYVKMDEIFAERGGKVQLMAICIESDSSLKFTKDSVYKYSGNYVVINDEGVRITVDEKYFKSHFCQDRTIDNGFYCWLNNNIISGASSGNVKIINDTIEDLYDSCHNEWSDDCFVPTIDDDINLEASIEDLGEFAIFSKEYRMGETVTTDGDVIYRNGKTYTLTAGTGYEYDEVFKEMVINEDDWGDYMDSYINQKDPNTGEYVNRQFFDTDYDYYGFKEDGEKVTGTSEEDVKNKLVSYYPIVEDAGVVINGDIYNINKEEYFEYNGKIYYVFREKDTETPYTFFNGKKLYAQLNTSNVTNICYRFSFLNGDTYTFGRTRTTASTLQEYISYKGGDYTLVGNNVTIDNVTYSKVDGYFDTNIERLYYRGTSVYRWYAMEMQSVTGYTKEGDAFKKTDETPTVYESGSVTGVTTSKLKTLELKDALTDAVGNMLPGRYDASNKSTSHPSEGTALDLLYEVGNTANIQPFSKTKTLDDLLRLSTPNRDENEFIGDIITDMYFYYKDVDGGTTGDSWHDSSLETIQGITKPSGVLLESENIFCDVTYCIGATLIRHEGGEFEMLDGGNSGVTYHETVEFEKKNVEYYLKAENKKSTPMEKKGTSVHSVSYPVVCYVLKQKEIEIDGEIRYVDNTTTFEMQSLRYKNGEEASMTDDMVEYNGEMVAPVFRMEYMLGSSTMQNIDVDIYIDRGINAALDKHLKLGEVTSMEALENYNNGFFKIMKN